MRDSQPIRDYLEAQKSASAGDREGTILLLRRAVGATAPLAPVIESRIERALDPDTAEGAVVVELIAAEVAKK